MVHIRDLEALEVTSEQYGSLLIPVIMSKLPSEAHLRIAQETGREAWRIGPLLGIIKTEVEAWKVSKGATMNVNRPTGSLPRNSNLPTTSSLEL